MKSLIASALYAAGAVDLCMNVRPRGSYFILMYHRVIPKEELRDDIQPGMYVERRNFESQLLFLKERFDIVPLSRMIREQGASRGRTGGRIPCVLTFDDGWRDFHRYAFPLLKTCGVPATVFLPTKFIGSNDRFWTDTIAMLYAHRRKSGRRAEVTARPSEGLIRKLESLDGNLEESVENAIAILKNAGEEGIRDAVSELRTRWDFREEMPGPDFMTWDEVRETRASGLVSFGSHTASHHMLAGLSSADVMEELVSSRERLVTERAAEPSFLPFCYPGGNYDDRVREMVRQAGYHLAVTTRPGWNDGRSPRYELKRIAMHQDMTATKPMFASRIARIW